MSLGYEGVEMLRTGGACQDGPKQFAIGGAYCKIGGAMFATQTGSLQNMLPVVEGVSGCGVVHKETLNTFLAIQFSLHRMTTLYHCMGELSEGCPEVR
jgi:Ni,Fe-hydrogenase III small subunit